MKKENFRFMRVLLQLFSLIALLSSPVLDGCTPLPVPFCELTEMYEDSPVFLAQVIDKGSGWCEIEIFAVLRGEEEREIIRIWDGPNQFCTGVWPAPAAAYGAIGDSIICIASLSLMEEDTGGFFVPQNDYFHCPVLVGTVAMKIENGIINSSIFEPWQNVEVQLSNFLDSEDLDSSCPGVGLGIDDTRDVQLSVYPNPAHDVLNIETSDAQKKEISIYSSNGQLLETITKEGRAGTDNQFVDLSPLPKGLLIVKVSLNNGTFYRRIIHK